MIEIIRIILKEFFAVWIGAVIGLLVTYSIMKKETGMYKQQYHSEQKANRILEKRILKLKTYVRGLK